MARFDGRLEMRGHRVAIRDLIVFLSLETDLPIVDNTGLTERYEFVMPWPQGEVSAEDDSDFRVPLIPAVGKYLGLSLVRRKDPVEMLVIDRLERVPVEN